MRHILSYDKTKNVRTKTEAVIPGDVVRNLWLMKTVSQPFHFLKLFKKWVPRAVTDMEVHSWWFDLLRQAITEEGINEGYPSWKLDDILKDYNAIVHKLDKEDIVIESDISYALERQKDEAERCLKNVDKYEYQLIRPFLKSGFKFIGRYMTQSGITRTITLLKQVGDTTFIFTNIGAVGLEDKMSISITETFVLDKKEIIALVDVIDQAYKKEDM